MSIKVGALFRLFVSVALIVFVLSRAELAVVGETIVAADAFLILLAFLCFFVSNAFSVARWRIMLAAHGTKPSFGYLYSSFMIGVFFNQILPTTVGGDVARYHYTSGAGRGKAFSAVFMDRVFGVVSLAMFTFAGLVFTRRLGAVPDRILEAVALLLALGVVAITVIFLLPEAEFERIRRLYRFLPAKLATFVDKTFAAFAAYRGRRDVVFAALGLSLLLQCIVVLHYYLIGHALDLGIPLYAYVYIVPVAVIIMMLPISINGIGVRESVFALLLGAHGAGTSATLAFSWIVYGLILVHGLVGGVVFAFARRTRSTP